jgi:hypothetical protein
LCRPEVGGQITGYFVDFTTLSGNFKVGPVGLCWRSGPAGRQGRMGRLALDVQGDQKLCPRARCNKHAARMAISAMAGDALGSRPWRRRCSIERSTGNREQSASHVGLCGRPPAARWLEKVLASTPWTTRRRNRIGKLEDMSASCCRSPNLLTSTKVRTTLFKKCRGHNSSRR